MLTCLPHMTAILIFARITRSCLATGAGMGSTDAERLPRPNAPIPEPTMGPNRRRKVEQVGIEPLDPASPFRVVFSSWPPAAVTPTETGPPGPPGRLCGSPPPTGVSVAKPYPETRWQPKAACSSSMSSTASSTNTPGTCRRPSRRANRTTSSYTPRVFSIWRTPCTGGS